MSDLTTRTICNPAINWNWFTTFEINEADKTAKVLNDWREHKWRDTPSPAAEASEHINLNFHDGNGWSGYGHDVTHVTIGEFTNVYKLILD